MDTEAAKVTPRKGRRKRWRLLVPAALLVTALFWWRPWQRPITVVESVNPKDGAAMVWVPAGKFLRGAAVTGADIRDAYRRHGWQEARARAWKAARGEGRRNNAPPRTVSLDGYWIYKYEVTVAQYRAFCADTGRALPPFPHPDYSGKLFNWEGKSGWADPALQDHPIVNVTWHDAKAYAKWARVSLPTEAQWEKAARGPDGRMYPWGNGWDAGKCANGVNSYRQDITTWPVGSFPAGASPYGAHDMAGNVWEWCADWYDEEYYRTAPPRNPPGPATGTDPTPTRVLRGGCWNTNVSASVPLRCSDRPTTRRDYYGFRCVSRSPGP